MTDLISMYVGLSMFSFVRHNGPVHGSRSAESAQETIARCPLAV